MTPLLSLQLEGAMHVFIQRQNDRWTVLSLELPMLLSAELRVLSSCVQCFGKSQERKKRLISGAIYVCCCVTWNFWLHLSSVMNCPLHARPGQGSLRTSRSGYCDAWAIKAATRDAVCSRMKISTRCVRAWALLQAIPHAQMKSGRQTAVISSGNLSPWRSPAPHPA